MDNEEVLGLLYDTLFVNASTTQATKVFSDDLEVKSDVPTTLSHVGRLQSDQHYVQNTSDYNQALLDAVIRGTTRRPQLRSYPKQVVPQERSEMSSSHNDEFDDEPRQLIK